MPQKLICWLAVLGLWCAVASTEAWAAKPVKVPIDSDSTGEFVLDCGDFVILEACSVHGHAKLYEDHLTWHLQWDCTAYNASDPSKSISQGPAVQNGRLDFVTGETVFRGLTFHITLPGYGKVFMSAGRGALLRRAEVT